MKLKSFSISNYRSITKAYRVEVNDYTILIGKNNEGKSNILKALSLIIDSINEYAREKDSGSNAYWEWSVGYNYSWSRDFPIQKRNMKNPKPTQFAVCFELMENEIEELTSIIASKIKDKYLTLEITFHKDCKEPSFSVDSGSRRKASLDKKSKSVAQFISSHISYNYIPAVRTEKDSKYVIERMIDQELRYLENNETYKQVMQLQRQMQQDVLDDLSKRIKEPLSEFLHNIKDVKIEYTTRRSIYDGNHSYVNVYVDDGVLTPLENKGDGVKSLATLGLLKNRTDTSRSSIIAIEEPEAHLHPGAMHQLGNIISSLSQNNQVIVSTHNPIFVNRENLQSNVLVQQHKAKIVSNVNEVRDALGVLVSDNLQNTAFVVVVEGETDARIWEKIISESSLELKKAIVGGLLKVESMNGAANIVYKLQRLSSDLCKYYVILDNDDAGKKAVEAAEAKHLIKSTQYSLHSFKGKPASELEDWVKVGCYAERVMNEIGIDVTASSFKGQKKWAERFKNAWVAQGKLPSGVDAAEVQTKAIISEIVAQQGKSCLLDENLIPLQSIINALELFVKNKND